MHFSKLLVAISATAAAAAVLPRDAALVTDAETDLTIVSMLWDGINAPIPANITAKLTARSAPTAKTEVEHTLEVRQQGIANLIKVTVNGIAHGLAWAYEALNWDETRERFTQTTVADMWKNNPDYADWPAAICYNQGYRVRDYNRISTPQSQKLKSGLLYTDYDCMFMMSNNAFWTDGDGGYQNLAYAYDGNRCSYDGSTGDLTC